MVCAWLHHASFGRPSTIIHSITLAGESTMHSDTPGKTLAVVLVARETPRTSTGDLLLSKVRSDAKKLTPVLVTLSSIVVSSWPLALKRRRVDDVTRDSAEEMAASLAAWHWLAGGVLPPAPC